MPKADIRVDSEIREARKLATSSHFSILPRYLAITSQSSGLFNHSDAPYYAGLWGIRGMRLSSLAYILLGVLTIAATYRILNRSPIPNLPTDQFDVSGRHPFEQKSDPLPIYKDESRLQDGDVARRM